MLVAVDYETFFDLVNTYGHPVFYATSPFKAVSSVDAFVIQHSSVMKPAAFDTDFPGAYAVSAILD